MKESNLKWIYLSILSLIWGTSFILIKLALIGLTPVQVGALRVLISAFVLFIVGYKSIIGLSKRHWFYITINAFVGSFIPVFLFSFAIDKMDSSLAAILNSFTPFNTLIFGALIFGFSFKPKQLVGIVIGLIGTIVLIYYSRSVAFGNNYLYMGFILIASVGYAFNVNIIKRYLSDVRPLAITTGNFVILIIPTLLVLYFSNFFSEFTFNKETTNSLFYIVLLSVFGTAVAKLFFNKLILISSPIFSTSVTYLIPIVAVFWGVLLGEELRFIQLISGCIILLGVYLVNKVK